MKGKKQTAAPESAFGDIVRNYETKGCVDRTQLETVVLPALSVKSIDHLAEDATFLAALLILVNSWLKQDQLYQSVFDLFVPVQEHWHVLFQRIIKATLLEENVLLKREALRCVDGMLGHLDRPIVRTEMMKYVSIGTWSWMQNDTIRQHYIDNAPVAKFWRNATKKLNAADEVTKAHLTFERSWLSRLIKQYQHATQQGGEALLQSLFLSLFSSLLSALPTRRFTLALMEEHLLPAFVLMSEEEDVSRTAFLRAYYQSVDPFTGNLPTDAERLQVSYDELYHLQRVLFTHFKASVGHLALMSLLKLQDFELLRSSLASLDQAAIQRLADMLHLRTKSDTKDISLSVSILALAIAGHYATPRQALAEPVASSSSSTQYLSLPHFLQVQQANTAATKARATQALVDRILDHPLLKSSDFEGDSDMLPMLEGGIIAIEKPNVGNQTYSSVIGEWTVDYGMLSESVQIEWASVRKHDLFLLLNVSGEKPFARYATLKQVNDERGEEVHYNKNRPILVQRGVEAKRLFRLLVDPIQYDLDLHALDATAQDEDPYSHFDYLVRATKEHALVERAQLVKTLSTTMPALPAWCAPVFFGFGDPSTLTVSEEHTLSMTSYSPLQIEKVVADMCTYFDNKSRHLVVVPNEMAADMCITLAQAARPINMSQRKRAFQIQLLRTQRDELLQRVRELAQSLKVSENHGLSCETATYFYHTLFPKKVTSEEDRAKWEPIFHAIEKLVPFERLVGDEHLFEWMLLQKSALIVTTRDDLAVQYDVLRHNKRGFSSVTYFGSEHVTDVDFYLASTLLRHDGPSSIRLYGSALVEMSGSSVMNRFARLGVPIQPFEGQPSLAFTTPAHINAGFQASHLWLNDAKEDLHVGVVALLRYMALLGYDPRDVALIVFSATSAQRVQEELSRQTQKDPWHETLSQHPVMVAQKETLPMSLPYVLVCLEEGDWHDGMDLLLTQVFVTAAKGLYCLGGAEGAMASHLFSSPVHSLKSAQITLVPNEFHPTSRKVGDKVKAGVALTPLALQKHVSDAIKAYVAHLKKQSAQEQEKSLAERQKHGQRIGSKVVQDEEDEDEEMKQSEEEELE